MEIIEHLRGVLTALQESPQTAYALMAEDIEDFLTDEGLEYLEAEDPSAEDKPKKWGSYAAVTGSQEKPESPADALRKAQSHLRFATGRAQRTLKNIKGGAK